MSEKESSRSSRRGTSWKNAPTTSYGRETHGPASGPGAAKEEGGSTKALALLAQQHGRLSYVTE